MHYYQHHIGDYRAATDHLSDEEDLIYRRLIELYYDTEQPIATDVYRVARRVRMHPDVVERVLEEFFTLGDDGYRHARCDAEIEQYRMKTEQASRAGKASAQRRSNARSTDVEPALNDRSTDVQLTMNHEPITNNQVNTVPTVLVDGDADNAPRLPNAPLQELLNLYHAKCPTLQRVMMLNDTRRRHLTSRWREVMVTDRLTNQADGLKIFEKFFERVAASHFLTGRTMGRNGRQWKATFDWLVLPTNFLKVCEGHYDNGRA